MALEKPRLLFRCGLGLAAVMIFVGIAGLAIANNPIFACFFFPSLVIATITLAGPGLILLRHRRAKRNDSP